MRTIFPRPTYYFTALLILSDNPWETATIADIKDAYAELAKNGEHPDHGGDPERWKLITAAYNELKAIYAKKRGRYESKTDLAWVRNWDALETAGLGEDIPEDDEPATTEPEATEPEAEETSEPADDEETADEEPEVSEPEAEAATEEPETEEPAAAEPAPFVFAEVEGESKDDRRRRYARERQQWRYATDPEFAASRRSASKKSHSKSAAAKKAAKAADATEQPAEETAETPSEETAEDAETAEV